jgi:hypothetical protein
MALIGKEVRQEELYEFSLVQLGINVQQAKQKHLHFGKLCSK